MLMIGSVRIPEKRKAALIGVKGAAKRKIEKATKTKIKIEDEVLISGEAEGYMVAENIVRAIGRGFSPQSAMDLTDEETALIVISLPRDEKLLKTVRSRLIGTAGKARRNMEQLTKTHISVYGRTVSIIGHYEDAERAQEAIEKL